jgi:hypothetical protein
MELGLGALGKGPIAAALQPFLKALRDDIADVAVPAASAPNRTAFVNLAVAQWSRMLSLFRSGALPSNPDAYEALSSSTPSLIAADHNAQAMGLGRLAIALSLLQYGRTAGHWELGQPLSTDLTSGAMTARALRAGSLDRPLFLVKSATDAIALKSNGAFANDNAIVVHADDTWHRMVGGSASPRRVRSAPGRIGRVGDTHVSLGDLLTRCGDAATLQQEFVAGMML